MRIGDHLLQDDQSISVNFLPILAAHKIFEKKKTWISSQRRTHEKNHAKKRTPLCQVLIFQLLWWLLVCAQLDIDGICQQWPRCFRSFPQSKAIWRATSGDPRLANHNRERSVTHEMSTSDIYTPLWALELFFEPICRYSSLYCRSHFSGQNIIQNNILVYYSFEFAILNCNAKHPWMLSRIDVLLRVWCVFTFMGPLKMSYNSNFKTCTPNWR